jgi:predicted RecB family nuclease
MLERLRATRQVVEIERPAFGEIESAVKLSEEALRSGAEVVFQAAFFDGRFLGYADFIIRAGGDAGGDAGGAGEGNSQAGGAYEVYDTKLARKAKITALLQLAAYGDQLQRMGIPTGDNVHLLLGDGRTSTHRLRDILPVYRKRRARLERLIDERVADPAPTEWGDPRYAACGRCDACEKQVQDHRDVLLVANLRLTQRARLRAAGVSTIEELAEASGPVPGISDATLTTLRQQAQLQVASPAGAPSWLVINPAALAALPEPDAGDIFFDFEGDPLYQEGDGRAGSVAWGLDYLFGLVEPDDTFRAFWAHNHAQERQALIDFLEYVRVRRARHPSLHIYHYAPYERAHLLTLAARHGVGEDAVDDLLRNHVLVDLYPVVRQGLRIGSRSYSLKKLEPLYMGDDERSGVANAADSIAEYVRYAALAEAGETDAAAKVLGDIARYNAYDCRSTLRLRDWLLARAAENQVPLATATELALDVPLREPDPVYLELEALLEHVPPAERTPDQTALALASAAIDYHRREQKSFWWDHFDRLRSPVDDWADTRDVLVIDTIEVERDWGIEGRDRSQSRTLRFTGTAAPGSAFRTGHKPYLVYDPPYPPIEENTEPGARHAHARAEILDEDDGVYLLQEKLRMDAPAYDQLPMALTPAAPPAAGSQIEAISDWGRAVLDALPEPLRGPAFDILRRQPPRRGSSRSRPGLDEPGLDEPGRRPDDVQTAIRDDLLALDRSYLAVQGPPGTGKTHTGSHVIVDLVVNHGWKIGVVAQSHAAVENMLHAVVKAGREAGLDPSRVGKKSKQGDDRRHPWTALGNTTFAGFTGQTGGYVVGGTAWDFSNVGRVPRGSLDLLVIDEAGQYSLASTIAAAVSAQRLLLLGDPQQLPQVSQGTHPEPVDVSALGWLSDGHNVLPGQFGYFLATSWRMHPAVCAPVSALSYEGKLHSHRSDRRLDGVAPGLHPVQVPHTANSTSSIEEADAVVALVTDVLGRPWTAHGETRPLAQDNVIVVAPYNAQVELIRARLLAAGLDAVPVGTVDKFQGREAAVAIVSLAASSAEEVPRGLEFLLMANRLNVAISRAQWAAYLVYSPALTEYLPTSVETLAQLSAFITLVSPD